MGKTQNQSEKVGFLLLLFYQLVLICLRKIKGGDYVLDKKFMRLGYMDRFVFDLYLLQTC